MAEWQIPEDIGRRASPILPWLEFDLEPYGGDTLRTYRWSDLPISLNGLYIEPRLLEWVRLIRALSDDYGGFEVGQFGWVVSDYDRELLSLTDNQYFRYWINRIARVAVADATTDLSVDTPFIAARGVIRNIELVGNRRIQFTAEDFIATEFSAAFLDEELPKRRIEALRFIDSGIAANGWNPSVDGLPEPIIYGEVSDQDLAAADRKGAVPCYPVGCEDIGGNPSWVRLLVAGHACKSIQAVYYNGTLMTPGADILAPGFPNWPFPTTYREIGSRRYTLMYVIGPMATEAVAGTGTFSVDVQGIETVGDGSGALITAIYDQYQHWLKNFALSDWQSGAWVSTLNMPDGTPRVDDGSFATAKASITLRGYGDGYHGGGVIGNNGELLTKRDIIYRFNASCDARSGFNRKGQFFVASGEPQTPAVTFSESADIIADTFTTESRIDELRNVIPFSYRMNYLVGRWTVENKRVVSDLSRAAYRGRREDQPRELHFVRDGQMALDIAIHFLHRKMHPPRRVTFETGLQGLRAELGQTISITHPDGPDDGGWSSRLVLLERLEWDVARCKTIVRGWDYGTLDPLAELLLAYTIEDGALSSAGAGISPIGSGGGGGALTVVVLEGGASQTRLYFGGSGSVLMQTAAGTFFRHPEKVDIILDSAKVPTKWIINVHCWTKNPACSVTPRIVAGTGDDGTGELAVKYQAGIGVPITATVPTWQSFEVTTRAGVWAYRLELAASQSGVFVGASNAVGGW